MSLVCAVIGLPYGIILAFVIITPLRTNVSACLVLLVRKRVITVGIIPCAVDQKEFIAVLAEVWDVVLLQSVEEIIEFGIRLLPGRFRLTNTMLIFGSKNGRGGKMPPRLN